MIRFILPLSLCALAGCDQAPTDDPKVVKHNETIAIDTQGSRKVEIFVDPKSHCQYLMLYDKGITPRNDSQGHQICER